MPATGVMGYPSPERQLPREGGQANYISTNQNSTMEYYWPWSPLRLDQSITQMNDCMIAVSILNTHHLDRIANPCHFCLVVTVMSPQGHALYGSSFWLSFYSFAPNRGCTVFVPAGWTWMLDKYVTRQHQFYFPQTISSIWIPYLYSYMAALKLSVAKLALAYLCNIHHGGKVDSISCDWLQPPPISLMASVINSYKSRPMFI